MSRKKLLLVSLFVFIIKLGTVYYLQKLTICNSPDLKAGELSIIGGDTFSYIGAIENYRTTGEYFFYNQHPTQKTKIYAGRMPYYGIPYYVFRLFFDKSVSADLVIITQILLESLSIVVLALLILQIIQKKIFFVLSILAMLVSLNTTSWSFYLLPESYSVSLLIFFIYNYYSYLSSRINKYLYLSGLFLSFLCLLKPYFVLLFVLLGIEFIRYDKKYKIVLQKSVYVSLPLLIMLSPWIVRNYIVYKKIVPFQEDTTGGYWLSQSHQAMNNFIKCWGGNTVFWETKAPSYYFLHEDKYTKEYVFPSYALTEAYTTKELSVLKQRMIELNQNYTEKEDIKLAQEFDKLSANYQKEKPLNYYLLSSLRRVKDLIFHSGSYYLPVNQWFKCYESYQMIIKIGQSLLYYGTLVFGFMGLIYGVNNYKNYTFIAIPIYILILFCFFIKLAEWRFWIPSYPILMIGTIYFMDKLIKYKTKNNVNT
ncbi:hypothetical protein AD998_19490 [bacterium 336/3]|nr:hypothetical protein AD998_19490 [bacterium 336/3]